MFGLFEVGKEAYKKLNDSSLEEAEVTNLTNNPRYANKTWAEVKAEVKNEPFYNLVSSFGFLSDFFLTFLSLLKGSFLSIREYKNPIKAAKEDVMTILKGGSVVLSISALLALLWKFGLIYLVYKEIKKRKKDGLV